MPGAIILQSEQHEVLAQVLADAVRYRDPPIRCRACEAKDALCEECAAGLTRARAYMALSRTLGVQEPQ
jgi:hypothetical protein